jgi:hypothetical protein
VVTHNEYDYEAKRRREGVAGQRRAQVVRAPSTDVRTAPLRRGRVRLTMCRGHGAPTSARRRLAVRFSDGDPIAVDDGKNMIRGRLRDAAVVERKVVRAVERTFAEASAIARRPARFSVRRERGNPPVRRIDHQRRLPERARAGVVPEAAGAIRFAIAALRVGGQPLAELLVSEVSPRAEVSRSFARSYINWCDHPGDKTSRYLFSIGSDPRDPRSWTTGTVYVLPRETFEPTPGSRELTSSVPVRPRAGLTVEPEDFPFRTQTRGHRRGESVRSVSIRNVLRLR